MEDKKLIVQKSAFNKCYFRNGEAVMICKKFKSHYDALILKVEDNFIKVISVPYDDISKNDDIINIEDIINGNIVIEKYNK